MTNSPPHNVKSGLDESGYRVLASGIDSLVLAINVEWANATCFKELARLKELAKTTEEDAPGVLDLGEQGKSWHFNVKPHGAGGYEWLLVSRQLSMKVGNWIGLRLRPSIMVELRSETLWGLGVEAAVQRVRAILGAMGATVVGINPSRVDLCSDILIPDEDWSLMLIECFVTRAHTVSPWFQRKKLSGFSLGSGQVLARIYDKDLEIRTKSRKTWMYDAWKLEKKPDGYQIIRVEFQLRREVLKQLGCATWQSLLDKLEAVWAYCTKNWLRVVKDASLHHTQQEVLSWWSCVSSEFRENQTGDPAVRFKAIQQDIRRLSAQSVGTLNSIACILASENDAETGEIFSLDQYLARALDVAKKSTEIDDDTFLDGMWKKQARYRRAKQEPSA